MPLVRPGGPRWALASPTLFSEPSEADRTPEHTSNTAQYTSSILETYLSAFDNFEAIDNAEDAAYVEALERIQEHLTGDADGMAACLVCLEDVRSTDPIWHCGGSPLDPGCFVLLHLPCAQAWARQQLTAYTGTTLDASNSNETSGNGEKGAPVGWGCPKCRKNYTSLPSSYSCFCGKVLDPVFNPWNAPHSCGEECCIENPICGHPCMLLCHPGPHPPCPRVVTADCFCGKESSTRRCGKQDFSCGAMCRRSLTTCSHKCPAICHVGACPSCIRIITASCRCGAISSEMRCGDKSSFRCEKVCGKVLGCGKHTCEKICCDGNCGECPHATGIQTCPCGKNAAIAIECGTAVPPCGQTCEKLLSCRVHYCAERCHVGPCPQTCRTAVEKSCNCGRMTRTVQCQEEFRCDRRCTQMRACGRHACKRRCCDGHCPPCEETCNKRLKCGNHRCPAPCHSGPCSPCPITTKISCACGKTSYQVPCGRETTALPPRCQHPCIIKATCRHSGAVPPHRCHYGPCPGRQGLPPCPLPCGAVISCGHACGAVVCHDPAPPSAAEYVPRPPPLAPGEKDVSKKRLEALQAPPAALSAAKAAIELLESEPGRFSPCPPCAVVLDVTCLGGHVTVPQLCSVAAPFSCSNLCGRPLTCGNHTCQQTCHDPAGGPPCQPCTRPCERTRLCKHACPRGIGCHPGECGLCPVEVSMPCHCGKSSMPFPCHQSTQSTGIPLEKLRCGKICSKQLPKCPHLCNEVCHEGLCSGATRCVAETTVRCTCKRVKMKLPCYEVAHILKKTENGDGKYDEFTSLRVLSCTAECKAALREAATGPKKGVEASLEEGDSSGPSLRPVASAHQKRLLQKERAAEAERREREKEKKQREKARQQFMRQIVRVVLLFTLIALVVGGGLMLHRLLTSVDKAAQEAWGHNRY